MTTVSTLCSSPFNPSNCKDPGERKAEQGQDPALRPVPSDLLNSGVTRATCWHFYPIGIRFGDPYASILNDPWP